MQADRRLVLAFLLVLAAGAFEIVGAGVVVDRHWSGRLFTRTFGGAEFSSAAPDAWSRGVGTRDVALGCRSNGRVTGAPITVVTGHDARFVFAHRIAGLVTTYDAIATDRVAARIVGVYAALVALGIGWVRAV
jgi:hypothetical protein